MSARPVVTLADHERALAMAEVRQMLGAVLAMWSLEHGLRLREVEHWNQVALHVQQQHGDLSMRLQDAEGAARHLRARLEGCVCGEGEQA